MIPGGYTSFNWNQFGLGQKRTAVKSFALLQVADMQGKIAEKYVYDPAGNILSKTIDGKTTTFTYDKANQLVSSTCDGKVTKYQYDAAGRLIQEGDKSYEYGWLDKVLAVRENGKKIASFDYQVDGQIAQAIHGGKAENFLWDDLALVHRGEKSFINEPYVTGGNPILSSKQGVMFNDMLGNTLGTKSEKYNPVQMTAFGETKDADALFTGKPYIGELGYAFLFRNYRADKGKWLSADPLGYPDGWNNFAYVNNRIIDFVDDIGCEWKKIGTYTGQQVFDWNTPPEIGYDTPAAAIAAMSSFVATKEGEIWHNLRNSYPTNPPHVVVMDSWDVNYVVRPMVGGNSKYYVARITISYKYTVYRNEE